MSSRRQSKDKPMSKDKLLQTLNDMSLEIVALSDENALLRIELNKYRPIEKIKPVIDDLPF